MENYQILTTSDIYSSFIMQEGSKSTNYKVCCGLTCKLTPRVSIEISQSLIENFDPYGNRSFHNSGINTK